MERPLKGISWEVGVTVLLGLRDDPERDVGEDCAYVYECAGIGEVMECD